MIEKLEVIHSRQATNDRKHHLAVVYHASCGFSKAQLALSLAAEQHPASLEAAVSDSALGGQLAVDEAQGYGRPLGTEPNLVAVKSRAKSHHALHPADLRDVGDGVGLDGNLPVTVRDGYDATS